MRTKKKRPGSRGLDKFLFYCYNVARTLKGGFYGLDVPDGSVRFPGSGGVSDGVHLAPPRQVLGQALGAQADAQARGGRLPQPQAWRAEGLSGRHGQVRPSDRPAVRPSARRLHEAAAAAGHETARLGGGLAETSATSGQPRRWYRSGLFNSCSS